MTTFVVEALRGNPELAIFLTVAIGFLIGQVKFGSFSLGVVVGCLLAGVLVGQLDIKVSPTVKAVFFSLFLFTTGYKVGPQFFRGLCQVAAGPTFGGMIPSRRFTHRSRLQDAIPPLRSPAAGGASWRS